MACSAIRKDINSPASRNVTQLPNSLSAMCSPLKSHLTILEQSSTLYGTSPAFRLPRFNTANGVLDGWDIITYSRFKHDVELFARNWSRLLNADGIPPRSVIGLWLTGMSYTDVLQIYGMLRAGFIPQLFSVRLPNPTVIFELLSKAGARALIYETSFASIVANCPIPTHLALDRNTTVDCDAPLPPLHAGASRKDTAVIFHTSGSTSGSPKLVSCNFAWLESAINKSYHVTMPKREGEQDVTVWMGSVSHIAQNWMMLGFLQHGTCTIQPSHIAFTSDELSWMINKCGLNRLNQFATFLAMHLKNARQNPKLAALLSSLDEVLYSGLPLASEEEKWAYENDIKLRNLFGNTECGAMLVTIGNGNRLLEPIRGTAYEFRPLPSSSASETGHQTATAQLLELIIRSDSLDCPSPSLCAVDGHYHTGDLFVQVKPGQYLSRGRNDDWIKSENSLRCDTKAIEDNLLQTCGDLIANCIVVGQGRPSPVLFVEPKANMEPNKLKREILRRTRPFHLRRYLHERIVSAQMIVVVDPGTLPRTATKGNIRRQATEELYKETIDRIFGVSS